MGVCAGAFIYVGYEIIRGELTNNPTNGKWRRWFPSVQYLFTFVGLVLVACLQLVS